MPVLNGKKEARISRQAESGDKLNEKTTGEIRTLLSDAKLDFELVENKALNAYLPRIFQTCPFSEDICTNGRCTDCAVFKSAIKV